MLEVQENREVLVGGFAQKARFSILASSKMFQMMIGGIYADKVKAVVRESCTNGLDSHIQANTPDTPIEVHLPTMFEPWYSVRDFGVGMSHDFVMEKATTAGYSSKDGSKTTDVDADVPEIGVQAAQTGSKGLGLKSPLAYTDTFSITCFEGNRKRVYNVYTDVDGMPVCALASVEDCTDPRGVEVMFPAKVADIEDFKRAAREVFRAFDVKPKLTGAVIDMTYETDTLFVGDDWKIFRPSGYSSSYQAEVRQGAVIYPLDRNAIPGLTNFETLLLQEPLLMDCALGELEVTPSRESLSYTPYTIENIRKRVKRVAAEVMAQISAGFEDQPNLYCARRKLGLILSELQSRYQLRTAIANAARYKNVALEASTTLPSGVPLFYSRDSKVLSRKTFRLDDTASRTVRITENTLVIVSFGDRKASKINERISLLINTRHRNTNLVPDVLFIGLPARRSKEFVQVMRALGGAPWVDVADLPLAKADDVAPARRRRKHESFEARTLDGSTSTGLSRKYVTVSPANPTYCVVVTDRHATSPSGKQYSFGTVTKIAELLFSMGEITTAKVVVLPANKAWLLKQAGWTNILDLAEKLADKPVDVALLNDRARAGAVRSTTIYRVLCGYTFNLAKDHPITKLLDAGADNRQDEYNKAKAHADLVFYVKGETTDVPQRTDTAEAVTVFKLYPLLAAMERYSRASQDAVIDYISLVDARDGR